VVADASPKPVVDAAPPVDVATKKKTSKEIKEGIESAALSEIKLLIKRSLLETLDKYQRERLKTLYHTYGCKDKLDDADCKKIDEILDEEPDPDSDGGGHIKKKLIRKKTYRNVSKITNNTSRKRTKLTDVFKTKRNKNKTLRKK
jgi:hypothetical protein